MEQLFKRYKNIQIFITEYRKYKIEEPFYDYEKFKQIMQVDHYLIHKCINTKKEKPVLIYLFTDYSSYINTTPQFKKLLDHSSKEPADIIIITKVELNIYIKKSLIKYPQFNVYNYLYSHFTIEISKGPLCSKHSILSDAEVDKLCAGELIIHPLSLPAISISDPQNIWIGGELGQVIKISSISEITGYSIRYRIVSPDTGKIVNIKNYNKNVEENL